MDGTNPAPRTERASGIQRETASPKRRPIAPPVHAPHAIPRPRVAHAHGTRATKARGAQKTGACASASRPADAVVPSATR
jgi:hypothetical protein